LLCARRGVRRWRDHDWRSLTARLLRLRLRSLTGLTRLSRRGSHSQRSHEPQRREFVSEVSHQKLNRAITSIVRIDPALVTRPIDDDPSVAESPENAGVFVRF
jgi:hypothetical protein